MCLFSAQVGTQCQSLRATAPRSLLLSLAHSSSYSSFQDFSGKVYTSLGMRPPHPYSYTVLNTTLHLFRETATVFLLFVDIISNLDLPENAPKQIAGLDLPRSPGISE